MGQKTDETPVANHDPTKSGNLNVLRLIGDTTWRMLIPSVGFTLLGAWLDSILNTKPWLMFAGIGIGCVFAVLLVARQIKGGKQ
jgi:F0F1-type ATP synthase assembly protein I